MIENESAVISPSQVPVFRAGNCNLVPLQAAGLVTGCTPAPANYQLSWGMQCWG